MQFDEQRTTAEVVAGHKLTSGQGAQNRRVHYRTALVLVLGVLVSFLTFRISTLQAGQLVPGVRTVAFYEQEFEGKRTFFHGATLNNHGQVAFQTFQTLRGPDLVLLEALGSSGGASSPASPLLIESGDVALYTEAGGNGLTRIAELGGIAPEVTEGAVFAQSGPHNVRNLPTIFDNVRITDGGHTIFRGTVCCVPDNLDDQASEIDLTAIYRHQGVGLHLVVREQGFAPGYGENAIFANLRDSFEPSFGEGMWPISANDNGEIAFGAIVSGTNGNRFLSPGIFAARQNGELEAVSVLGDSFPFVDGSTGVATVFAPTTGIDSEGQVSFMAGTSQPPQTAMLREKPGGFDLLGPASSTFQTATGEVELNFFYGFPAYNDVGQVAVSGNTDAGLAIFSNGNDGQFELVAKRGDPISEIELVVTGITLGPPVAINNVGETTFFASVGQDGGSDNHFALLLATNGGLSVVARSGDHLVGLRNGVTLDSIDPTTLSFNDQGQLAFVSTLSDGGAGIFAQNEEGQLRLVVRLGDLIDVDKDPIMKDWRTVTGLQMGSGVFGHPSYAFNDRGEVTFVASFAGATGVFVADVNAIPEPGSFALALSVLGVVGMLAWRRRKLAAETD